jgi:hypothetical protein
VLVVVHVSFVTVLRVEVPMRSMAVLHRGVVVPVAVHRGQMIPAAHSTLLVAAAMGDVHVFVVVIQRTVEVALELRPFSPAQTRDLANDKDGDTRAQGEKRKARQLTGHSPGARL